MVWTRFQFFLVSALVVSGSFNTLSTKWADRIEAEGSDGTVRKFNHPFLQTVIMFAGEVLCLVAFRMLVYYYNFRDANGQRPRIIRGNNSFSIWIFLVPSLCDIMATSIMYIGLTLTFASSFQMLRGSLIVFVALLSVGFLGRTITWREISGIFFVITGLAVVGVSDVLFNKSKNVDSNGVITGDLLIILAQIITAVQIVVEEHFVRGKDINPLQAVGLEGCFGFTILGFLLIPLYYIPAEEPFGHGRLEDLRDAFTQISNNPLLMAPIIGNAVSIAFFNFTSVSVTKEISGTTRTVMDSVRTFFVWMISLALQWEDFAALQIVGFFVLLLGIFIYNDILIPSAFRKALSLCKTMRQTRGSEILINQEPDDVTP